MFKATRSHCIPIIMVEIWHTDSTKCWRGCGAKRTFIHCWKKCKMMLPLQKTVWQFLTELCTITIQCSNRAFWCLPNGVENLCPHKNLYIHIYRNFIHYCLTWKPPQCLPVSEWVNKLWYIWKMEISQHKKMNYQVMKIHED